MIARGNRNDNIFLSDSDYQKYKSLLAQYKKRYLFKLYSYALMSNHVHLLIESSETPLSKIMQGIQQSYTQFFNMKYKKGGHLFQGRYKALLCQKDAYLLELIRYIHLNPVRSGISKLDEYLWSSFRNYYYDKDSGLVDTYMVLSQFSENPKVAREQFKRYLYNGLSLGHQESFYQVERQILGEKDFIDKILSEEEKKLGEDNVYIVNKTTKLSLDVILDKVCKKKNIPTTLIKTNMKASKLVLCRDLFIYIARIYSGYQVKDIASFLGISISAITKRVFLITKAMAINRRLATEIEELIREIESIDCQA